jgi:hypothetical protein
MKRPEFLNSIPFGRTAADPRIWPEATRSSDAVHAAKAPRMDRVVPPRCRARKFKEPSDHGIDHHPGSESRSAKDRRMPNMLSTHPPLQFEPALHRPRSHRSGPAAGPQVRQEDSRDVVSESCPFLDRNDERCASRFSLGRLEQMLDVCLGTGSSGCLMYHRLRMEEEQGIVVSNSPVPPLVMLTHDGESPRLRPTGS